MRVAQRLSLESRALVLQVFDWIHSGDLSVPFTLRLDPLSAQRVRGDQGRLHVAALDGRDRPAHLVDGGEFASRLFLELGDLGGAYADGDALLAVQVRRAELVVAEELALLATLDGGGFFVLPCSSLGS